MPIKIVKPQQKKYLSPDDMIKQNFSSNDNPAIEFSRYLNHYLELSGDNIIINGFQPFNLTFTDTSISVSIVKGKLIQDLTIIETTEDITLIKDGLDDVSYPDIGSLLVFTDYSYSNDDADHRPELFTIIDITEEEFPDQTEFNPFGISIEYYDGSTVNGWNPQNNRIVLTKIDYIKSAGIITFSNIPNENEFIVDGVKYTVRGASSIQSNEIDGGEIS